MRVPLTWLAEFVDIPFTPEALAERLTLLGMEVKSIERRGDDWRDVVVGELLSVEPHPRADRLLLTTVTLGSGAPLRIVCGATNIAVGQRVPVALPGAVLPGGRAIERAEKLGVESNGMLCSGDELRLTADADGILILPGDAPLGARLADLYGETVLDVDVKPNRGDALSILGLAREVAAATAGAVRPPDVAVRETGGPVADRLRVEVEDPRLCPRFVGRWCSGVSVGPSPDGVQMRLLAAGVRPVSNVVDASNYVMLELGKPIHTFDAAAVRDGRIVVRLARPGERLTTLDHVDRELDPEALLIADPDGPLGIAGVMGGAASEVGPGTTDVVVESAIFDPVSIRRTAFRYGLRSEASLRFEKGQEHGLAELGADRTARLISEWAGGSVAVGRVDTAPGLPGLARVPFRPARVDRLLGASLSADEQRGLLRRVGIVAEVAERDVVVPIASAPQPRSVTAAAGDALVAVIPAWRGDISVEADIVEEIARIHGYDRLPTTLPRTEMPGHRPSPLQLRDDVRVALAGAGLTEVVTHALVSERHIELWSWRTAEAVAAGEGPVAGSPVRVTNPLSIDHGWLRRSLVGGLLDVVSLNLRRGRDDAAVFEVGKGYGNDGGAPREWWRLGIGLTGAFDVPAWNRLARPADIDDLKGIVEALARRLGAAGPVFEALEDEAILHPGRASTVLALGADGGVAIAGRLGEVHPAMLEAWGVRATTVVAELSIAGLSGGQLPRVRVAAPPRHQETVRDIAVVVADGRPVAEVAGAIGAAAGELLESVRLFDVYRGAPLATDERSLAFRLTFRARDRTLTEAEVDDRIAVVVAMLERAVGGRIRG